MNKTCTKCGETKPTTEFHKNKAKSDGLRYRCKVCHRADRKAWREANPEKVKARSKAWREANPEKAKACSKAWYEANREEKKASSKAYRLTPVGKLREYEDNAKRRGIPFLLTEEEFNALWQKPCHYCGAEIKTIGLDRVDNYGPYHIDNVVSCCASCNRSKQTATLEEWLERKNDNEKETEVPCNA